MLMIRKSMTMSIKKMILHEKVQIDHSPEVLNTRGRMVMHYRISMDDKGRIITHTRPPNTRIIEIMMMMMTVKCGSDDLRCALNNTCMMTGGVLIFEEMGQECGIPGRVSLKSTFVGCIALVVS